MIFKIQRPIAYGGENEVLVYNEDRSIMGQFPMPQEQIDMIFEDGQMKTFVEANHNEKTGQIEIMDIAEWQDW